MAHRSGSRSAGAKAPRRRAEKTPDEPRTEKRRAVPKPEKEKTRRDRVEKAPERDRDPRTIRAEEDPQRPEVEELGGESEYSLREAQREERGSTRRKKIDPGEKDHVERRPDPHEMWERYLEGATQAQADDYDDGEEPVLLPRED